MRVLVSGGLGYVGRAVAARLVQAGHEVTALTRDRGGAGAPAGVAVATADLRDPAALAAVVGGGKGGFDAVCHLAALTRVRASFADPVATWAVNVGGTIALLEALAAQGRPAGFVLASTGAVYGPRAPVPAPEDAPLEPSSPYAATKAAAEALVAAAAAAGHLGAVTLRVFNVSGAVDGHGDPDGSRLVPAALDAAAGRRDAFDRNGDGAVVREFVHVADLADAWLLAVEAAAEPGRHRVYNAGSGTGVTVAEVLATVERVTGRPVPVRARPPADEPAALVADSGRIRAELGWAPTRSSIERIVADAWRAHPGTHVRAPEGG